MASVVRDIGYGREFQGWYDRLFPDDTLTALTVETLVSLLPGAGGGALELGAGTGRVAIPLSRFTPVVAVDSSKEMIQALDVSISKHGANVQSMWADMRDYADDEQYAIVYCICGSLSLLLEVEEQQEAMNRAAARLAPGGLLVVETYNRPAILAMHGDLPRTTYFTKYPEPGTGVQTHSTLVPGSDLWECAHIWFDKDGTSRVGHEISRLISPEDVDAYAANCGLSVVAHWADWNQTPYHEQSGTYVCVYQRAA
ncbi:class I SAM-dependent methyltransferase [Streptomyces sp. NRRL B-1347]|uniref:class I SAM-dependent methyltransferase n=1 Tax=Streptomyces sp. NRRL B-1347 TaxID=1476877 RepID=UPI00068CAB2E|nr:class I SAM-dependent methyltransferase [Streptomyces sp. NRRL B-1347]